MKNTKKILSILLFIVAVICLLAAAFLIGKGISQDKHSQQVLDELRPDKTGMETTEIEETKETKETEETVEAEETTFQATNEAESSETETASEHQEPSTDNQTADSTLVVVENPYRDSYLANSDMVGWLQIPGTNIDYPVMWTPRDENYYLYRAFDGSENKNGSLILDTDSSLDPLTTNLIIHGHNMRSGEMFGNLTDYEDPDYFEDHKQIILYTGECQRNYEIVAVFRSQVYKKNDQVFKFYKFFQADTQAEFDDFYKNIKDLALYDTGVTAQFGDHFITLSTCVYHVEQGRFVVVAKEVEAGDYYLPITE